jgi:sigma-B regulation protein RsbU (phosphoserine phosphatase)
MFATAVYVYLDLKTGVLSVSSAGHPAPILKKANGETIKLTLARRSMALGFLANTTYQNTEFELENGSRLLLYTDGLIEARDESGEEMGINHLIEHYNQCKPGNTQEFVHEALTCVARYTKCANLADDICMLGVAYSECPELSDF